MLFKPPSHTSSVRKCSMHTLLFFAFLLLSSSHVLAQSSNDCLPAVESEILSDDSDDDLCTTLFAFHFEPWWAPGGAVVDVGYELTNGLMDPQCVFSGTAQDGVGTLCLCDGPAQTFKPTKDNNHLNGVSTFDLVLISRHILGLTPFTNPYQMIAADADKSESIAAFDIVEIQKLILGIYTKFPGNTSWRFVDADFVFPNLNNPFQTVFPEVITFGIPQSGIDGDFIALKVGDVNQTAIFSKNQSSSMANLGFRSSTVNESRNNADKVATVFAQRNFTASAWQMALKYNSNQFKINDLKINDIELTAGLGFDWYEPFPGEIRVLFFDAINPEHLYEAGDELFVMEYEATDEKAEFSLTVDESTISAEAYAIDSEEVFRFALSDDKTTKLSNEKYPDKTRLKTQIMASVYPNPNTGRFRLTINLPESDNVSIQLIDQQGNLRSSRSLALPKGDTVINTDAWPRLLPGTYILKINTTIETKQMSIVVTDKM